jgi:hypothetical protein
MSLGRRLQPDGAYPLEVDERRPLSTEVHAKFRRSRLQFLILKAVFNPLLKPLLATFIASYPPGSTRLPTPPRTSKYSRFVIATDLFKAGR